jgi:hypothetical protein
LCLLAASAAILVLAVLAPFAFASIAIQNPKAKPVDTTQAGASTRFETKVTLGGSEHIKDFTTKLPYGFGANTETPVCSMAQFDADTCPANTQIATTTVNLTIMSVVPSEVGGRVYFIDPAPGGGLPRLGIILDAPTGKQRQIGEASIDPQTGTLENTIRNFPQDADGVPIRINSIDVILKKTFAKNPAECVPATTTFLITSYEDPGRTTQSSDSYTPTGCENLPPAPNRARCKGQRATKVGNKRSNHINGTPRRDVIAGLGGNDVIRGLKGNDIICGGVGNDKLIGGPGSDTLVGGAGKDKLIGGPNKDRLIGGPGADTATQ